MKKTEKIGLLLLIMMVSVLTGIIIAPFLGKQLGKGTLKVTRASTLSAALGDEESGSGGDLVTSQDVSVETPTPTPTSTPTPTPTPTATPTPTPTPVPTVVTTSFERDTATSYYWPDSDKKYYSEADLVGLTDQQIATIRNEIYAREGYIFKTDRWRQYFQQKEWYHPRIKADDFTDSNLNQYEYANVQMVLNYEKAHHLNGH